MSRLSTVNNGLRKQALWPVLSLFTSLGTLVCCALPALLVTLGLGATLAGLVSSAPWLVVLSDHKKAVFSIAGTLLAVSTYMQWRFRDAPCPAEPSLARACMRLRITSRIILGASIMVYATGFFFAFLAADIFYG